LRRSVHAGEHAGPAAIRDALEICQAERIGHGVRAVEEEAMVRELALRGTPLEVCPSSNICLGVFPRIEEHSFDRLHRAGVAVTINSDDPPMFGTTLVEEYLRLHDAFGYDREALAGFARAALRHAFLTAEERPVVEAEFERRLVAALA
jgi:adenosine deaminase